MSKGFEHQKNLERARIQSIRQRCGDLCASSLDIKNNFEHLRIRLEEMERVMGYYGAHEKFRS
jgi:hypothetical protein